MTRTDDGYELSTGRKIYANGGFVGINEELDVREGYDGNMYEYNAGQLTPAEQAEICDFMIGLWQERKAIVAPELPEE